MMQAAGVNTLRTYEAILNDEVLALVSKYQLHMIVPAFNYFEGSQEKITTIVQKLKGHPMTLIWEVGNEWNYNKFYSSNAGKPDGIGLESAKKLVLDKSAYIKTLDKTHPVSTVYGELPSKELIASFPNIDVWGINVYSGLSFADRFDSWLKLSTKPLYVGEFGADAINKVTLDTASQVSIAKLFEA